MKITIYGWSTRAGEECRVCGTEHRSSRARGRLHVNLAVVSVTTIGLVT
jgi:hypothetical protein